MAGLGRVSSYQLDEIESLSGATPTIVSQRRGGAPPTYRGWWMDAGPCLGVLGDTPPWMAHEYVTIDLLSPPASPETGSSEMTEFVQAATLCGVGRATGRARDRTPLTQG